MTPTMRTTFGQHGKKDVRPPLQKALEESDDPRTISACPHGCGYEECDDIGYCRHLIGFVNTALPDGVVAKADGSDIELLAEADPIHGRRRVMGKATKGSREKLRAGDYIVRCTAQTCRVYRNVDAEAAKTETKKPVPAPAG